MLMRRMLKPARRYLSPNNPDFGPAFRSRSIVAVRQIMSA